MFLRLLWPICDINKFSPPLVNGSGEADCKGVGFWFLLEVCLPGFEGVWEFENYDPGCKMDSFFPQFTCSYVCTPEVVSACNFFNSFKFSNSHINEVCH